MSNRIRRQRPIPTSMVSVPAEQRTYWNGTPTPAAKVRLRLITPKDHPQYWAAKLAGTIREAVRVTYAGRVFYLDNADGSGWAKVTQGGGSPRWPHRSVYGREVLPWTPATALAGAP